jgi:hypothetical protein
MRQLIHDRFNNMSFEALSVPFLNMLINDGYKDVSIKGFSYESRLAFTDIPAGNNIINLAGLNVIRPAYVTYNMGSGEVGMVKILPHALGHIPTQGNFPQFWFPWGDRLVIDPAPDVGTYDLCAYSSCLPAAALALDTDVPSNLPVEFHECVFMYAAAMANLKYRAWGRFVEDYNDYIREVQRRRFEYIKKIPDGETIRKVPDSVEVTYGEPNVKP